MVAPTPQTHCRPPTTLNRLHRVAAVRVPSAGPWCTGEDEQLTELVKQYGGKHWARIASMLPGRTGKQCRERWCNNLDPSLKKGAWTQDVSAPPRYPPHHARLPRRLGPCATVFVFPLVRSNLTESPPRHPAPFFGASFVSPAHPLPPPPPPPPWIASSGGSDHPRNARQARNALGGDCKVPPRPFRQLRQEQVVLDLQPHPPPANDDGCARPPRPTPLP